MSKLIENPSLTEINRRHREWAEAEDAQRQKIAAIAKQAVADAMKQMAEGVEATDAPDTPVTQSKPKSKSAK